MEPGTGDKYLLYKQRIVFSLLRAAARVGVRLGMPLKQMALLQEMACFREARLTQGMKLDAIAELFDKSLRTVSSLNHRFKDDFFRPEREVAFRRAIAALANHAPISRERLAAAFPDVPGARLETALDDLVREGSLLLEGDVYRRNPEGYSFVTDEDLSARVDGLNRQMDVIAEAVQGRFLDSKDSGKGRSWVFQASPEDFEALVAELEKWGREKAMAADRAAEEAGGGKTFGLTFAAAPMKEN